MKTIVIALGGNALIGKGQKGTAREQLKNLKRPLSQIAKLSMMHRIVITHGNGPQVGNLLLQQKSCAKVPSMPLEVLVAQTQGAIGYMIEETLDNELMKIGVAHSLISTVITFVQVNEKDPAFKNPTKPIGPPYLRRRKGYIKTQKGWQKVVPSPKPIRIVGWPEIKKLIKSNFIVISCGGGGIPVTKEHRRFEGIEAVIDKDLVSAKLGEQIGADILVIATDINKVALNYAQPDQQDIDILRVADAKKYLRQGFFPAGSMGPKVQAAINFLESGKKLALITSIEKIDAALKGRAGTRICW